VKPKRLIALFLALSLATLSGCGGRGEEASTPAGEPTEGTRPEQTEATTEAVHSDCSEEELAAAAVLAVSMAYPDFALSGIYVRGGAGAYVLFSSGGRERAVESLPLAGERTQSGTRDISTAGIGCATFDEVSPADLPTGELRELTLEDLEAELAQAMLVSIYER